MLWINRLLYGSVRENEQDVWPSAYEFLEQIDPVRDILRRGGQIIEKDVARWCRVCGWGKYQPIINENSPPAALINFGLQPTGMKFHISQCSSCGHLEMFRVGFSLS